jgi:hypothetical protein
MANASMPHTYGAHARPGARASRVVARCISLQTNPDCCAKSATDIVRNGRMEALPLIPSLLVQRPCGSTVRFKPPFNFA